jgi:hypothetical protein
MLRGLRDRITYANVVSTLALFIAMGGGVTYAASKIDGSDIRKRSLTSKQFKSDSIGRRVVKESSLRTVPRAFDALRLKGLPATAFVDGCPQAFVRTVANSDVCIELGARQPQSHRGAALDCKATDSRDGFGRRLPTYDELMTALADPDIPIQLAQGGELTSDVYPSSTPGKLDVLYITAEDGSVGITPDSADGAKSFRCVADPMNVN